MIFRNGMLKTTLAALLLITCTGVASAARARFHYVAADASGTMVAKPGPCGTAGERRSVLGKCCDNNPPKPTCWKCFRHPCTGQTVKVPLALPEGTPSLYYRRDRVSFDYGSYNVIVFFLEDGTVDVVYDSGLFRAL